MSDLLIHSMREFGSLTLPALNACDARVLVEIGAERGGNTELLSRWCADRGGHLTSIDPAPSDELLDWARSTPHLDIVQKPSLEVIDALSGVDAWFVDGDHNWYTVYHELQAIHRVCRRDGRPMLVFLHDVGWPNGRRDFYYAPERVPEAFRHAHSFEVGVTLDAPTAVPNRGLRGHGAFAWALHEGGPRNGVLTAIEDFVAEWQDAGERFAWACVPAVFGLGVLFDLDARWASPLADVLAPWHNNPLLMSLEENRLRNYLAVIDWQDRPRAAA